MLVLVIICTSQLIAGFKDGEMKTYNSWELGSECRVSYVTASGKKGTLDTISVNCGLEEFRLPVSQCAINKVKKD